MRAITSGCLMVVLLLASCGRAAAPTSAEDRSADTTTLPASTTPPATTAATVAPQATTLAPATTSPSPETTSTTLMETTTTGGIVDVVLPGPFGTMSELLSLSDMFSVDPLDAQIVSYFALDGDEEFLASLDDEARLRESVTITYFGEMTIWDFPGGYREVSRSGESFYLDEDGSWYDNDRWEWPPMGPFYEWDFVQGMAPGCIEFGAEVLGLEDVAGATTLHIRCTVDGEDQSQQGFSDVWIGEQGHVMKSYSESWEDPSFRIISSWEVTGLDVAPDGPLPPGW